jgi:vanillate O-demethylase ferredoxin subunit
MLVSMLDLFVKSVTWEAEGVLSYDLRAPDFSPLPAATAGAHIDLVLTQGLTRSYSLLNAPGECHRYWVAVQKDPQSRGGSSWIHQHLKAGDRVQVQAPRNHFALVEDPSPVVLIGGGIGITPLVAMVAQLHQRQTPWTLYYSARTRARAAFVGHLQDLQAASGGLGELHLNFDQEPGGQMLDLAAIVKAAPAEANCSQPTPARAGALGAFFGRPSDPAGGWISGAFGPQRPQLHHCTRGEHFGHLARQRRERVLFVHGRRVRCLRNPRHCRRGGPQRPDPHPLRAGAKQDHDDLLLRL